MTFKLATLPKEKIKTLPTKLKEEIDFVKDNTENYGELYYEAFQENDERLFKLAEEELKKEETQVAPKEKTEKKVAPKAKEKTPTFAKATVDKPAYVETSAGTEPTFANSSTQSSDEQRTSVDTPTIANSAPQSTEEQEAPADNAQTPNLLITNPKVTDLTPEKKEETDLSYKRKVPEELLKKSKKVQFNCQFQTITAEKDLQIEIMSKAKKGDKILIHEDGYPFAVMNKTSFEKRCTKVIAEALEEPVKTEIKQEPIQKEEKSEAPKEESILEKEPAPKKPDPGKCNIDDLTANPPIPLLTWLNGQIELWKSRKTNQKVTKIMATKATGEIIIEFTHYDKLLRIADLRLSYHQICLESTKLTKTKAPKRGTYRLLVSKAELRKEYSTKRNWNTCRTWIREAYGCAKAGNCTQSQRALFKKFYHQCGDQVAKQEDIAYLRWLHQKAGEQWKKGKETYLEAFGRVRKTLRESKYSIKVY